MINMKMSKKAATALVETAPGDMPAYPYGLRLCLDTETLEKLGITEPPAVGTVITLHARAEVVSTGVNQKQDGDRRVHCDLQITDMEFEGGDKSPAEKLYAGMEPSFAPALKGPGLLLARGPYTRNGKRLRHFPRVSSGTRVSSTRRQGLSGRTGRTGGTR